MGISRTVVDRLNALMRDQDRSAAWVARRASLPYKRVLAQVKHKTQPITLETAIAVAEALGADLTELLPTDIETTAVAS